MLRSIIVIGVFHLADDSVRWSYGMAIWHSIQFSREPNDNAHSNLSAFVIHERFVIRNYGISGIREYIRRHIKLAQRFECHVLKDKRFEICNEVKVNDSHIHFGISYRSTQH